MTREDIVRLAREAGYNAQISNEHFGSICYISQDNPDSTLEKFNRLERFATLVASAERERLTDAAMKAAEKAVDVAMALEREACANLVDHILKEGGGTWGDAIRARGSHD